jgi:wyosine [tRNA(Phe)-imidazoG37] synthetase (radical SAM superfamily)
MQKYVLSERGWKAADGDQLVELMPAEPCLIYTGGWQALKANLSLVKEAKSRSRQTILSASARDAGDPAFLKILSSLEGLYALSVRYSLNGGGAALHTGISPRGKEGDLLLLAHFRKMLEIGAAAGLRLIPEIEVKGDLSLLGPTLMALVETRPPWMILSVNRAPTPDLVGQVRACFEYLKIRNFPFIDIHFSFESEYSRSWTVQTENSFCGPEEFHIDLSNRCTHSCLFCGLYSPVVIEELKSNGSLDAETREFMTAQLDEQKALELIQSLPLGTRIVQFGGAGDPMLHPRVIELIGHLRERAVAVEILSNMEYLQETDLQRLTQLGAGKPSLLDGAVLPPLLFTVNLSAATAETYVKTRPRQTEKTFDRVLANLRRLSELRAANQGRGAQFRLMCVQNRLNFREAVRYVELARSLGAVEVWFKPLEIHHRSHYGLEISREDLPDFRKIMEEALETADRLELPVHDRQSLLKTMHSRERSLNGQPALQT